MALTFESADKFSITTMNVVVPGKTEIYFCEVCGHLQTNELDNVEQYYAEEYSINSSSEDEDQLYAVINGAPIYRAEHQAKTLNDKVHFEVGWNVLDYGCAKAPTLKKLIDNGLDVNAYLFDVTKRYVPFWERFPPGTKWAVSEVDRDWVGQMDVVLSFYALEHVVDLKQGMENITALMRVGGVFYFIVPNVYKNIADFIVADHVNHFSRSSLHRLMKQSGFVNVDVDDTSHDSAFVVSGEYVGTSDGECALVSEATKVSIANDQRSAREMADYWSEIIGRIHAFEASIGDGELAIYGAGFYGNFIASVLKAPGKIQCFIDRNEYLQGASMRGIEVLSPANIPDSVTALFVGVNPAGARDAIKEIGEWEGKKLDIFYL
ncbi:class I SAM-dependent methyltransferase [Luminiphilus sp.]|nr:class I SAM-dependent methyltransferase [Luminiphilus sp.]